MDDRPDRETSRTTLLGYVDHGQDPPCLRYRRVDAQRSADRIEDWAASRAELERRYDRCRDDGDDGEPAQPGIGTLVDLAWEELIDLPSPTPSVQHGDGVTGIPVYLTIDGPQQTDAHFGPDDIGFDVAIDIETTSTYTVDWGDGHVTEHTTRGGPHPEGDIRHGYADRGTYTITVTQHWTATWTASGAGVPPGAGGTIDDVLRTTGTVDVPVDEIQSIRQR